MRLAVTTQAELDAALADQGVASIDIDSPRGEWLTVSDDHGKWINAWGASSVVVNGASLIGAYKNARIIAFGDATVIAYGHTRIKAFDDVTIYAHEYANVKPNGSAIVYSIGRSVSSRADDEGDAQ